jgi:hypothetical protein
MFKDNYILKAVAETTYDIMIDASKPSEACTMSHTYYYRLTGNPAMGVYKITPFGDHPKPVDDTVVLTVMIPPESEEEADGLICNLLERSLLTERMLPKEVPQNAVTLPTTGKTIEVTAKFDNGEPFPTDLVQEIGFGNHCHVCFSKINDKVKRNWSLRFQVKLPTIDGLDWGRVCTDCTLDHAAKHAPEGFQPHVTLDLFDGSYR